MRRGELSAAITQLISKCLWSGWKWSSPLICFPVNHEYLWKKTQIKKKKKANYAMQHVITDSRCMWMKRVLNLSWRRSLLYRNQYIDLQNKSMNWFLYDQNLRQEGINALLLAYVHLDIFLEYDKIIDICASK